MYIFLGFRQKEMDSGKGRPSQAVGGGVSEGTGQARYSSPLHLNTQPIAMHAA